MTLPVPEVASYLPAGLLEIVHLSSFRQLEKYLLCSLCFIDCPIRKSVDGIRLKGTWKGSFVCLWIKRNVLVIEQNKRKGKK